MNTPERTSRRPDPRPMRLLYGAGAAAAMSAMVVTMVQPGAFPASAEEPPLATVGQDTTGPSIGTVVVFDGATSSMPAQAAPRRAGKRDAAGKAPTRERRRARARTAAGADR